MDIGAAIATITEGLRHDPSVSALFLGGSHAVGLDDDHSDLDFLLVAPEGATDKISELWRGAVNRVGGIVLWRDREVRPALINAITADWLRVDAIILRPDQMAGQAKDRLRVLFDPQRIHAGLPDHAPTPAPSRERFRSQCDEFIRVLGLLGVVLGRKEYLNGVTGIFHLRNLLVDLLIEETGAPHRGGALHLNRLITEEQKDLLASLPAPVPTRAGLIAAHMAYARAYLPRARSRAAKLGAEWPERFEAATWAMLREAFGLEAPYPMPRSAAG